MQVTKQFIVPPAPAPVKAKCVYPWETTELNLLCQRLYTLAAQTGYTGTLDDFKIGFGAYLEANNIITTEDFEKYVGQYEITPLPLMEQILQTADKVLTDNIVVAPIPYYEVSNEAGGITVSIG